MAETNTIQAAAYTARGTSRDPVALPSSLFDGTVNMPVMHQAVKAYLANQRQGNAATKIRKYVIGGNQKPWRQKGTGRARQGSTRAPHWVGGGTVFGPIPRSYAEYVPRQVRALARKSAFNARARENAIVVIDAFAFDAPKTRRVQDLVDRLGLADRKVLVLTHGVKPIVYLSARNIPNVHVMPYDDVSTYHLLWSDVVLIESGALGLPLEPIAEGDEATPTVRKRPAESGQREVPAAKRASAASGKRGATGAKRTAAKKGGKRPIAKKAAAKRPKKKGK